MSGDNQTQMRIAFAKTGWSESYNGDDVEGQFEYLEDWGDGAERFNFKPGPDRAYYGYLPPIGEARAVPKPQPAAGWLVIWVAKLDGTGPMVPVGWYEDATFTHEWCDRPEYDENEDFETLPSGERYCYSVHAANAVLIPADRRHEIQVDSAHLKSSPVLYAVGHMPWAAWRDGYRDLAERIVRHYAGEAARYSTLDELVARVNELSAGRSFGALQNLRKEIKGLSKRPTSVPFPARPNHEAWVFHVGGRQELQFNIGRDEDAEGRKCLRHGVAFSLEPGQDLPKPEVTLAPAIGHFNDWIREHSGQLSGIRMWNWNGRTRGPARGVGPVPASDVRRGRFLFAGWLTPLVATERDIGVMLDHFDQLMALYEYVLRSSVDDDDREVETSDPGVTPPMSKGKHRTLVRRAPSVVEVELRHRLIQEALYKEMVARHGRSAVQHEFKVPTGRVDLRVREPGDRIVYFEVKTASSARACVRQALGQLLEYALWPGCEKVDELVVASDRPLSHDAAEWLREMQQQVGIPLRYFQIELATT